MEQGAETMAERSKRNRRVRIEAPWSREAREVAEALGASTEGGLSSREVESRRRRFGRNKLREVEKESTLEIFLRQFKSIIMLVLALAAGASFAFGEWIDAIGILIALFANAAIGFFTELQAVRSMESLQEMDVKHATVRRDGRAREVEAEEIVPGDLVALEGGDIVTADMRVIESNRLQINESALTGESVPVQKSTGVVDADAPLAERKNMAYKGTAVTEGSGFGIVVATGMDTEIGGVASMVQEAHSEEDPLKQRLDALAGQLVRAILLVAVVAGVAGIIGGKELFVMIETSVALFVAAVPEGLPIVATLALARGMHRMAKRNALVRRLSAVQTLGSTNVIFTDKTGTLTENQMTATDYSLAGGRLGVTGEGLSAEGSFYRRREKLDVAETPPLREAIRVGVLCNNASLDDGEAVGDPMEVALIVAGRKAGVDRGTLLEELPEAREIAFDPDVKMMATFHQEGEGYLEAVKGAPHAVLDRCTRIMSSDGTLEELGEEERDRWLAENEELAADGLRVLALAEGRVDDPESEPYEDLTFLGLVGLLDPPREEVKDAIALCRRAGIKVIMVTGDQQPTAVAVGRELGIGGREQKVFHGSDLADPEELTGRERHRLLEGAIFCRVSPEQKLNLIQIHQEAKSIVAMTGDGVNDAPALKKADIGVAMGLRGEPVAEDAADILLQDDRFATITAAVEHGRIIFENIRTFVLYMISGNVGEILVVFLASVVGAPLPLLPLQILYINVVNDIFPALALGLGPGSGETMSRPPRDPTEPIMGRRQWLVLSGYGLLIGLSVLGVFALALAHFDMEVERAVTISFLTVALARLLHVFNMRNVGSSMIVNQVTTNPFVWAAILLCLGLLSLAIYIPPLASALDIVTPTGLDYLLVVGASLVPLIGGQLGKGIVRRYHQERRE